MMKTNELIEKAKAMGFEMQEKHKWIGFFCNGYTVAIVNKYDIFSLNTNHAGFRDLDEELKKQFYKLLTEYASTPVEEREEDKKYMYRLKKIEGVEYGDFEYLNWDNDEENFILEDLSVDDDYTSEFTHSWLKRHGVNIEQLKEFYEEIEVTK